MKQLTLSIYDKRKQYKVTKKNEILMKKCFTDGFKIGMVSHETYKKVINTNYINQGE
jgi:hypothetical protein